MVVTGTDYGGSLGAGDVEHRYDPKCFRFYGVPDEYNIPVGYWAVKEPNDQWWWMLCGIKS